MQRFRKRANQTKKKRLSSTNVSKTKRNENHFLPQKNEKTPSTSKAVGNCEKLFGAVPCTNSNESCRRNCSKAAGTVVSNCANKSCQSLFGNCSKAKLSGAALERSRQEAVGSCGELPHTNSKLLGTAPNLSGSCRSCQELSHTNSKAVCSKAVRSVASSEL